MIKAEKTILKGRINLVDTEISFGDDNHYIRQISEQEAILLLRSLMAILIPIKVKGKTPQLKKESGG